MLEMLEMPEVANRLIVAIVQSAHRPAAHSLTNGVHQTILKFKNQDSEREEEKSIQSKRAIVNLSAPPKTAAYRCRGFGRERSKSCYNFWWLLLICCESQPV